MVKVTSTPMLLRSVLIAASIVVPVQPLGDSGLAALLDRHRGE
jgi:hypothetical protein